MPRIRNGNGRFANPHGTAPAHTGGTTSSDLADARPPSPEGKAAAMEATDSRKPHRSDLIRCARCDLIRPRCARPPSPEGKALRTDVPDRLQSRARGERPHPTSLRPATFPGGEGCGGTSVLPHGTTSHDINPFPEGIRYTHAYSYHHDR